MSDYDRSVSRTQQRSSKTADRNLQLVAAVVATAVIAAAYGVLRWREHRGHSPDWGDVPTWLTFIAAALGIPFALYQFNLQRKQLREQQAEFEKARERQVTQDKLLAVQLQQAEASLRVLKRQQAEAISLRVVISSLPPLASTLDSGRLWTAAVKNESRRPIKNVCAQISPDPTLLFPIGQAAGLVGHASNQLHFDSFTASGADTVKPGETVEFRFNYSADRQPKDSVYAEFTDDAGTRWRLNDAMSLREL